MHNALPWGGRGPTYSRLTLRACGLRSRVYRAFWWEVVGSLAAQKILGLAELIKPAAELKENYETVVGVEKGKFRLYEVAQTSFECEVAGREEKVKIRARGNTNESVNHLTRTAKKSFAWNIKFLPYSASLCVTLLIRRGSDLCCVLCERVWRRAFAIIKLGVEHFWSVIGGMIAEIVFWK